jgi:phosphoglucosamine mutase
MPRQLFGTDGIRGVAGEPPLDDRTVFAFGVSLGEWAVANAAQHKLPHATVALGMDTRQSGPRLASLVAAGLAHAGARARFAGVTTTPGVAYITRVEDFVAGVMISASHNPFRDNGLKAFDHSGFKLPDDLEHTLEQRIFDLLAGPLEVKAEPPSVDPSLDRHYIDFLASTFHHKLAGLKIVLDCANGAAYEIAPELFRSLGAEVIVDSCAPNGENINLDCGALHTARLQRLVVEHKAGFGAAFDGDADRCMIVSPSGKLIDGDHVLLVCARHLNAPSVVATIMSNIGLEVALKSSGISLVRTTVGDKYVLEEMLRRDLPIGGEQSGHVIFRQFATTGDGILTALRVLDVIRSTGLDLDSLTADFKIYPQTLVNVRFKNKRPLDQLPAVQDLIRAAQSEFGDAGRINVRFSGTEPLARVMVEGPDTDRVHFHARRIADAIASELS